MSLSIRHKLFLTLLLATALVVAAMYGFMRWSFQQGFVRLVEGRQQARVERLVLGLVAVYAEDGGWDRLRAERHRWRELMIDSQMRARMAPDGDGEGSFALGGHVPGHGHRGPMLGGRLALLDADKAVIFGRVDDVAQLLLTPIRHQDRIVGYVGLPPGPALSETVDIRFVEQQGRAFILIALLVGALSMALAWLLAHTLVRPVRRITDAARALAAGRYTTRVAVESRDELGELARDFNTLAQGLERTEQARRQWVADISHELRTPLAVLRAELEALQDGVRPLEPGAVTSLLGDVERLHRLVEDLYQLSMSDLGTLSYRKTDVDPVAILRDDVEGLEDEFARRQIKVAVAADLDAAVVAYADPDRLSQLYRNLLTNSLRYTDPGGRLEIRAGRGGNRLTLDFQDSAPAVPDDALAHLFERFYRVEGSRSRVHGGAGLGLAICRNIVEAHDGRIEAHASPLGGLWIRLELPLKS